MTPQRIIGIALIVLGLVLVGVGFTSTDSVADKISETFTGRYTQRTMAYLLGGAATSVAGLVLAVLPRRKAS